MSGKQKILVSLVVVAIAAIAGIAFAVGYIVKGPANSYASPNSAAVPQVVPQDSAQLPAEFSQKAKSEVAQASDVSVRLVTASSVSAFTTAIQAEVCIELPSTEDWNPEASLIAGGQTIPAFGWGLLGNTKDPATYASRNRCYKLDFALPKGVQGQAAPLRIVLERLFIPPPDMPTEEQCAQAQQKLDEAGRGIEFTCRLYPEQGGWGYDLVKTPQDMSEEQIGTLIMQAFRQKVVEGPWEFTLDNP